VLACIPVPLKRRYFYAEWARCTHTHNNNNTTTTTTTNNNNKKVFTRDAVADFWVRRLFGTFFNFALRL
jgi:hypothetical protein